MAIRLLSIFALLPFIAVAQSGELTAVGTIVDDDNGLLWSGIIDGNRATDWQTLPRGALGGVIPERATICATLSPGATAAQINTAITNCPTGQTVFLNAGTYNLSGRITFGSKSNVTLRGAGADQTILDFSAGGSCIGGFNAGICSTSAGINENSPPNTTTWTAGYSPGTTVITVGNATNMTVGKLILLDQLDDATDSGGIYVCSASGVCADEGGNAPGRTNRSQIHIARVVSKSGNNVTIHPPLTMPNWRSGQSPGVYWNNSAASEIQGIGIEDLTVDVQDATGSTAVTFGHIQNSWVKGIRSIGADRAHVWFYKSLQMTARDSYFYGGQGDHSESYGVENYLGGWNLIENNIFNFVTGPIKHNGQETGSVIAYNFSIDDNYTAGGAAPQWMIPTIGFHEAGVSHLLHEGNDGLGYLHDDIHGTVHFNTAFRNHFYGDVWNNPAKNDNTAIINIGAFGRYFNIIGNVLGRTGYYNTYQTLISFGDTSIYNLGWPNDAPSDARVAQTMMRWGNYDTVNNAVRWQSSEVPTADAFYPNAVPSSQTLPASFYRTSAPDFWETPWGTPPWPAIGPDVSGGNISGWGGRANKIPARLCYENTAKVGKLLTFNADACYEPSGGANIDVDFWQDFEFTTLSTTNLNANDHVTGGSWSIDDPEGQLATSTTCERSSSGTFDGLSDSSHARGLLFTPSSASDNTGVNYSFASNRSDVSFGFWYRFPSGFLGSDDEHDLIQFENNSGSREYYIKHTDYEPGNGDIFLWTDVEDESGAIPIAGLANQWLWVTGRMQVGGTYRLRVYNASGTQIGVERTRVAHPNAPSTQVILGSAVGALNGHTGSLCFDDFIMDWTDATYPLGPPQ